MSEAFSVFKAAILALLVSALIWVWAEGETLSPRSVVVTLAFPEDPANELVVRPEDPGWSRNVTVKLEGPVRATDQAATLMGSRLKLSSTMRGMPSQPGQSISLDLREAISGLPNLAPGTVAGVEPRTVLVRAVRMVTRELPVRVDLPKQLAIDGDPVVTPPAVQLRIPESVAAAMDETSTTPGAVGPGPVAIASISQSDLASLRGDGPQTLQAPVRLPPALLAASDIGPIAATPEKVSITFRVKKSVDAAKLPTVPVWFSLPPTEDGGKWSIEILDKFLGDATLTGPSDDVRRIKAGEVTLKAVVELSSDELERAATDHVLLTKTATFIGLPTGVNCTVPNASVRIKVTRREAAPE